MAWLDFLQFRVQASVGHETGETIWSAAASGMPRDAALNIRWRMKKNFGYFSGNNPSIPSNTATNGTASTRLDRA